MPRNTNAFLFPSRRNSDIESRIPCAYTLRRLMQNLTRRWRYKKRFMLFNSFQYDTETPEREGRDKKDARKGREQRQQGGNKQ